MPKQRISKRIRLIIGLSAVVLMAAYGFSIYRGKGRAVPEGEPSFNGKTSELRHTQVVATLDAATDKGKNAIWCISFESAWKVLQDTIVKEPILLEGADGIVRPLNQAPDPGPQVPAGCLYAAAGWEQKGIIEKICGDLRQRFPTKEPPVFPGIARGSFVAYSYLQATVKFSVPYFQNRKPLRFMDSSGKKAAVSSFGIRQEDDYAYSKLRQQPAILFEGRDKNHQLTEYIVDLDRTSEPSQIILALVDHKSTLADTVASIEDKIASYGRGQTGRGLGPTDVLLAPDIFWQASHRFAELERRRFANSALKGQSMDIAQQDIMFRLDRSGAELRSEAKMYAGPVSTYYLFDRPFFVCMSKRGAGRPYFVMWVDNAELLRVMTPQARTPEQGAAADGWSAAPILESGHPSKAGDKRQVTANRPQVGDVL